MKKSLLILLLSISTLSSFAQTYKDKAAEIQKAVMADAGPEFAIKDVPAQYANESAVILAKSQKIQRTTTSKLKIGFLTGVVARSFINVTTIHERVKINDKAALDDFSSLTYQKQLDKSQTFSLIKFKATHETFVGAKIIKPNGKEIIVNTGEEVLLKDSGMDKQGKLAISDLQVGDILDYYILDNDLDENMGSEKARNNQLIFMQVAEYPILNYSLDLQISKKFDMKSISANGAKLLTEKPATDEDRFYTLQIKNIPKYQNQIWTSPYRQYPYIEVYTEWLGKGNPTNRLEYIKNGFKYKFDEQYIFYYNLSNELKEHFNGSKGVKAAPLDSTLNAVYNIMKHKIFNYYNAVTADGISELNYRTANSMYVTASTSMALVNMKIDHDVLLVSSRNSSSVENAFDEGDLTELIRINSNGRYLYMCFYDPLLQFNELPPQFQGENVIVLKPIRKNSYTVYTFTESTSTLPVTTADQNVIEEQLTIDLPVANIQKLNVKRKVKQSGYLRFDDQRAMVNAKDVDKQLMDFAKGDDLVKRIKSNDNSKKLLDALLAGMTKTPAELQKLFSDGIKNQFDQEPKELSDCKIVNAGLSGPPVFEYSSSFTLDNLVKKASNNYIIDAGKLCGTFLKLEEKDRKRVLDVYMPGARTFKYSVNVNIPKGYKVKGIEELNRNKGNNTGSFSSSAKLNGNVLNISVNRVYNHNFEKLADWPLVTEIVDFASAFNDQKILLEKEG